MDNTQIEFENRSQEVQKELSLKEITQVFIQNWPLFLLLFVFLSTAGVVAYKYVDPYVAKSTIVVNDMQNSQLQLFAQGIAASTTNKMNEAKKPNSIINKRLDLLMTTDFYNSVLQALLTTSKDQLTLNEYSGLQTIKSQILKNQTTFADSEKIRIFKILESMLSFKIKTDYELEITASNDSKDVALCLVNIVTQKVMLVFKNKETEEINAMFDFLNNEKNKIENEMADINKKMSVFADKPENIVSISSKDKVADYMAELMTRKSEVLLKISENNKIIQSLKASSLPGRKENQLYGNNGKVQTIILENDLLKAKLGQIQSAIDTMASKAKNMPYLAQMYDELKKRSDQNLQRSKEIADSLTKVEALKLASANKYEIYEPARYDKVSPQISLSVILFLAVLLSQVFGSLIIYLRAIWDTNIITAHSTRNIVVVNSHSLDPRVIIENSKIKFRLRNSSVGEDDQEFGRSKKIGFNFNVREDENKNSDDSHLNSGNI